MQCLNQRRSYNIFNWGGARHGTIEVGAIQAVVKNNNYLTNTLLGEFKNITQYIINNKHILKNHKNEC